MIPKKAAKEKIILALTGSIGAGKSTVAEIFQSLGALCIDADELSRQAVAPRSAGLSKIISLFGEEYLLPDGTLDRAKLGELVFNDSELRKQLEEIVHPQVRSLYLDEVAQFRKLPLSKWLLVYQIPLLFESGGKVPEIDFVAVVSALEENCISRIIERDSKTEEEAHKRYHSQLSDDEKRARADFIIENNGTLEELKEQVSDVMEKLKRTQDGSC